VLLNNQKALVGLKVTEKSIIKVPKDSGAVIQFINNLSITLRSGTEITVTIFENENGKNDIEIFQKMGRTFSKLIEGKFNYSIMTSNTRLAVSSSSFEVIIDKNKNTEVKVLEGKVEVSAEDEKSIIRKPVFLLEGAKIISSATGLSKQEEVTNSEKEEMNILNSLSFVDVEEVKLQKDSNTNSNNKIEAYKKLKAEHGLLAVIITKKK